MSKNPLLARVFGESCDVVPVLASLPRTAYRERQRPARRPVQTENSESIESGRGQISRMIGESSETDQTRDDERIIPDDADPVSPEEMTVGKPLRPVKDVVQEPSHPEAEKEKLMTPYSALTAPDVTPMATQPIDPSQVPGADGAKRFTAADLERNPQPDTNRPLTASDINPMDILLGRNREPRPAANVGDFQQAGAVTTEEQAAALLGITTPLAESAAAKAAAALTASVPGVSTMPPPSAASDGAAVYSAFRRFNG